MQIDTPKKVPNSVRTGLEKTLRNHRTDETHFAIVQYLKLLRTARYTQLLQSPSTVDTPSTIGELRIIQKLLTVLGEENILELTGQEV